MIIIRKRIIRILIKNYNNKKIKIIIIINVIITIIIKAIKFNGIITYFILHIHISIALNQ
jgi:hypothetical protein